MIAAKYDSSLVVLIEMVLMYKFKWYGIYMLLSNILSFMFTYIVLLLTAIIVQQTFTDH